jgi:hypothetical protein
MDKLKQHIQNNFDNLDIDSPSENTWNAVYNQLVGFNSDNQLKDHIGQHADELEIESPDPDTWKRIEKLRVNTRPARVNIDRAWLYAAACLLILMGLVIVFNINRTPGVINDNANGDLVKSLPRVTRQIPNEDPKIAVTADRPIVKTRQAPAVRVVENKKASRRQSAKLPQEIVQIQSGYGSLIASQVKQIQSMPVYGEAALYFESFVVDFKKLDQQEKQLRKTVMQEGLQENSLDELALIYQQKLTILKMLQREIDKADNREWNVTDTIPKYIKL